MKTNSLSSYPSDSTSPVKPRFGLFSQSKLGLFAKRRWIPLVTLLLTATVALVVIGATTPPNIKGLALSSDPLFAATGGDKPVIALALSVEFPTVGAQYLDANYSNTNEYLGYYDAESCYTYNNAPSETPASGLTTTDYKRFDRTGAATNRMCTNAFSGNFLNWSSSSAIDMLRLALSGGDRYIDTPSLTILQRAVIPNGDPSCFWNTGNFPSKQLQKDGGGTGKYWGAIPTAMITQAAGSNVFVANTLNQIFFGTSATGGCGNTAAYTLGAGSIRQKGTTASFSTRNAGLGNFGGVLCAAENAECNFTGVKEVLYGAQGTNNSNGGWVIFPASEGVTCNTATIGVDPAPGTVKSCYTRNYTGSWTPTPSTATLNTDGFFYSRVQVCNSNVSGVLQDVRDFGLCTKYPNGNFKPTGSIQKYSDQLRLAAFGYLMDQTQSSSGGRYGGVLRAPMKFVGAKTFDETGLDNTPGTGNPKAEWNANTGVFAANPDGDTTQATPISGVINYLNKFGRTGPTPGRYKIYDAVGELYGETLRYLQGLGPTPGAVSGLTTAMYDGYPVYTAWTDPYGGSRTNTADYSCLKSNIVVIGDVNTHDGNTLLTRTANTANNIQDFSYWKGIVNSFESNASTSYLDGQGVSRTTGNPNTPNTQTQSVSSGSQVLTGQAYWAHTHDIRGTGWTGSPALQRPGLRTKSFFFDVNENGSSNTTAYRQNRNQFFTSAKYGGFESDSSNIGGKPYNAYGNPFKKQDGTNNNDVWQDVDVPGEASTFYLQSSARDVLNAFDSIFSRASTSARSIAKSAISNQNLTAAGSTIYQGAFDTSDWSGDVLAIPVTVNASNTVAIGSTPNWQAVTKLGALAAPATTRNIVVGRAGATTNPPASDFQWASIDSTLQVDLAKLTPASAADGLAQDRLNYIRGDRSKEGAPFRLRSKLLGDVVNSGIVYSGTPTLSITPGTAAYNTFFSTNSSRTPAVFVGANDGMLHAFNANTGDELFGYIPSWMGPKLAALTATTYNSNHQAYVDATPAVAEAQVGSAGSASDWKTVLVGGTGAGGPGVYALDVTTPSTFSASNVMWEFTQKDDASMGYVVGRPQILKLRTSAPGATTATYRWFAVVASGVNNYTNPDSTGNYSDGNPALFLLALDKPAGTAWTSAGATPNYYKLTVPVDSTLSVNNATGTAPGLINFAATFGLNKELAQIYMGDLHGKLWKLDFTQRGASEWTFDLLSYFKKGTAPIVGYPMFIAKTSGGLVQPISMPPIVVSGPVVGGVNTSYVSFGTGKYLETGDKTSTLQNSFYTVYDNGSAAADTSPVGNSAVNGRGRLQAGTVNVTARTVTFPAFKIGRATSDGDSTQRSGWYFDFAVSGERSITSVSLIGDTLKFGSLIPAASGALGSCVASGGSGQTYEMNIDSGNGSFRTSTVGLLGEPLLIEVSSATTYTVSTTTGRRIKTTVTQNTDVGSQGVATSGTTTTTFVTGRLSWRQINNYLDLKNAP
ncbi:PilC/PilY family type IV pilus protein [Polaromonas sp.]|uniref:pilus assembly protein n=1 Tax=Polaromonas sp. TaxID=1869339 RepID=UPI0032631A97